ncbi:L-lactate dehydrogenase [Chroogloeocystis siderophila]|jgi:L-lactate dehydrogenase|uniref:L-lactate dehydrogenase n=1 Tax=Chroogloeocystis siderophila 5.2 s.c.1 TaxID=247279 RepID=A0A1U7HQF1_9CHRO|nr:L-lactate dehydrogenase [Chroogloeocystis siderophila]OKH25816.1 L-lactate dehydrogenase [Chroogloeocystis siderophila 5.2 s.c.1]
MVFDNLFTSSSEEKFSPIVRQPRKGVIIGAGQVGMACAYSLLIQNLLDEMIIVDVNQHKLEGEVMDLNHGLPFVEPTLIRAGTLADGENADIVIITAGVKQKPGESRLDLVNRNVEIFQSLIPEVVKFCSTAILLIVTNPVDIMTYVCRKISGLPSSSVIGSGTVLDTARFRYLLAEKLQIDPRSLHAYIIGEHGDSEVPVWSKVNISGMHLVDENYEAGKPIEPQLQEIFAQVKNAAYEIIQRKGATSYAIGLAVAQIVQSILRNQNRVLTVSSLINGIHGINDVCLSLPAVVNRQGVTRVVNLALNSTELEQLQHSGKVLRQTIEQLDI